MALSQDQLTALRQMIIDCGGRAGFISELETLDVAKSRATALAAVGPSVVSMTVSDGPTVRTFVLGGAEAESLSLPAVLTELRQAVTDLQFTNVLPLLFQVARIELAVRGI